MDFPFSQNINSISQTDLIAANFSKIIRPGDLVLLNGNLGSGKTTFIKSVCRNYRINNVSSPSFSIVNEYIGVTRVFHFDFYRLKSAVELFDIGFEEYLNDEDAIVFIEWAELFSEVLPKRFYEIKIEQEKESDRIISIRKND